MRVHPLPIPTRLVGGEAVNSYSGRHARNNGLDRQDVEATLRQAGKFPTSRSKNHPDRLAVWRALGNLHRRAFTEPQVVAGNWVIDRPLCERCLPAHEHGWGRLPWAGWVCLKHKRWIKGDQQVDLARFGEALVAERHWRGTLTPKGVVVDSPVLLLAQEAATVGISKAVFEGRAERVSHPSPGLLVYPETVRLARLLTRTTFLDAVLGDATGRWKRATVEREVRAILPDAEDGEAWRAVARVWDFALSLQDCVRDGHWLGQVPEDRWNVLQYSRLAEAERGRLPGVDERV